MNLQSTFDFAPPPKPKLPPFDGATIEPVDQIRLTGQWLRVFNIMADEQWRTLSEIRALAGRRDSEAGISARLRDFRKAKFGGHLVNRRRRGEGTFEYQLIYRKRS